MLLLIAAVMLWPTSRASADGGAPVLRRSGPAEGGQLFAPTTESPVLRRNPLREEDAEERGHDDLRTTSPVLRRQNDGQAHRSTAGQPNADASTMRDSAEQSQQPADGFAVPPEPEAQLPFVPSTPTAFSQEVTTVARQESTVGRSPAAVFVVTQEMIQRCGARSIPEALRMVPGLFVARIDANKWSVSCRGFSSRFARKLLVQIDGRTVYTPLFSGTFWEIQDYPLNDIERIEVIRGPGATIWGENAVNGIINIITKSAKDTQGAYAEVGGGTEERGFVGGRVGGCTENGIHWRVYGKGFERDRQFEPQGRAFDDWRQSRAGFRADWQPNCSDTVTVQGDIYQSSSGTAADRPLFGFQAVDDPASGGNVLARFTREFSDDSDMALQVYYDRTDRRLFEFDQNIDILDIDFQYRLPVAQWHNVIWGLGYRQIWDHLPNTAPLFTISMDPTDRATHVASGFVQDEVTLLEDYLYFTAGTKVSHNSYTDWEVQPSARVLWLPDEQTAVWGSISRAVRTPSRAENDGRLVVGDIGGVIPLTILGNRALVPEEMMAYEIGVRRQPVEWFSWDLALFYFADENLTDAHTILGFPPTFQFVNGQRNRGYGGEIYGTLQVTPCWQLSGSYSLLRLNHRNRPDSIFDPREFEGSNPQNQVFLMSSWDLANNVQLDVLARYVDNLFFINVPSYTSLDVRLAYRPSCNLEIAVVGQNLLDSHHPEYTTSVFTGEIPTEVQRSVYAMLSWGR
jgi:iron complex outermembrane receptor protein